MPAGQRSPVPSTVEALERVLEDLRRERPEDDLLSDETALFMMQYGCHLAARGRGVCQRTLRREFERRGTTLSDHLLKKRKKLALTFLADGVPVGDVARRLGFASSQTFARFVQREFATTATVLRRRFAHR